MDNPAGMKTFFPLLKSSIKKDRTMMNCMGHLRV